MVHLSSLSFHYTTKDILFLMQAIFRIHSPPHTHTFRLKTAVEDFIRKEQKDRKVKRKRGND